MTCVDIQNGSTFCFVQNMLWTSSMLVEFYNEFENAVDKDPDLFLEEIPYSFIAFLISKNDKQL